MSDFLVYESENQLFINQHRVPPNLHPYLHVLLKELQKQFPDDKQTIQLIPQIAGAVRTWIAKYRFHPPLGEKAALPQFTMPAPSKTSGYVVEVRSRIEGKTLLKRYSCMDFESPEAAIAAVEALPDVAALTTRTIKHFIDEQMRIGDKRRTYVMKGVIS